MLLVLLLGCVHKGPSPGEAEREAALGAAEQAWRDRAEPGALEASVDRLEQWLETHPQDHEALANLARAEWVLGQRDPGGARDRFEAGQDAAARCLLSWPAFEANVGVEGYRVTAGAVDALPAAATRCMLWDLVNGVSRVDLRGPGASLDLEELGALAARLDALKARPLPGFREWAVARLQGLAPDGGDPRMARELYQAAIAAAPDVLLFRLDFARTFPDARDLAMEGWAPAEKTPWAAENAAWSARAGGTAASP